MYLSKKTYVKQWSHNKPEDQYEVSVKKGGVTYPNIRTERVSYVTEELMYWRKANQIHGWFVNNCEEDIPDVKYSLGREQLVELVDICKKVLEILNTATKLTKQVVGGWRNGEDYMVDVEVYDNIEDAILCEKRIKEWNRMWKTRVIEERNPQWRDLYAELV